MLNLVGAIGVVSAVMLSATFVALYVTCIILWPVAFLYTIMKPNGRNKETEENRHKYIPTQIREIVLQRTEQQLYR